MLRSQVTLWPLLALLAAAPSVGCGSSDSKDGSDAATASSDDGGKSASGGSDSGASTTSGDASQVGVGECPSGYKDCDGNESNGCETDIATTDDCGDCSNSCAAPNASVACNSGVCTMTSCTSGFADCDKDPANGCEVDLSTKANCGSCGMDCGMGDCMSGACTAPGCDTATTLKNDCDGDPATGCETSVNTLTDCGNCRVTCDLPNGTESCTTGTCEVGDCDTGFGDCDAEAPGCETELVTNLHCAACNTPCAFDNAAADCSTGTCTPGDCATGFGDCNTDKELDGCETLLSTLSNCGTCGVPCDLANASESCGTGVCTFTACNAGYVDVNQDVGMMVSDGCECQDDQTHATCGTAKNLGNLPNSGGASLVTTSDKIAVLGDEDWYTFTLANAARATHSIAIDFTANPGGAFKFDLVDSCVSGGDPYPCKNATVNSAGLTSYSFGDQCSGGLGGCNNDASPKGGATGVAFADTAPTVFLIRVYRTGAALSCAQYTLRVDRN